MNQKAKGNLDLIVKGYPNQTNRLIHYNDIAMEKYFARNIHIAKYFGINSIQKTNN